MIRTFAGRALVAVAICTTTALMPAAAHAEKSKATDASADVVSFDANFVSTPAPDNTDADVIKSIVNHSKSRVSVKLKLRDLTSPASDEVIQMFVDIRSNKQRRAGIVFKVGAGKTTFVFLGPKKEVKCKGAKKKVSVSKNLVKLSIPRSCLGNPRWIKAGIGVLNGSDTSGFFFDDALAVTPNLQGNPKFTPKLKRG